MPHSATTASPPAAATTSIATLRDISKTYGAADNAFTALHPLSLTLPRGEMIALVGPSGSGKSTLLNLLGAVDRPTTGSITIAGDDLTNMTDAQLALVRRRRLGYVFQSFHLVPSLTVFDNVAVPFTLDRKLTADRRNEVAALLKRLGLADKSHRYPDELSGGQQQRVALARAVIHRPHLVLADEPTGNLDHQTGTVILDLLSELQQEFGVTIVMATHSEDAASRCSTRLHLSDGRIVTADGATESS